MKKIREIITELNVAISNGIEKNKYEELKEKIKELLPYADLEETYGIDLITLNKIRQASTICYKGIYWVNKVGVFKSGIMVRLKRNTVRLPFTTYGIDWALNKKNIQPKKEVETE